MCRYRAVRGDDISTRSVSSSLDSCSCLQRDMEALQGTVVEVPPVAQASPVFGRDSPGLAGPVPLWVCMIIFPGPIVSKH